MTDLLLIANQDLHALVGPILSRLCDKTGLSYQVLTPEDCAQAPSPTPWTPRCVALLDTQLSPADSWWPDSAVRVIPSDHPLGACAAGTQTPGKSRPARGAKAAEAAASPVMVRFGPTVPSHPGDFGMMRQEGLDWLVRAWPASEPPRRRKAEPSDPVHLQTLMPVAALGDMDALSPQWVLGLLASVVCSGATLATALHALGTGVSRQAAVT